MASFSHYELNLFFVTGLIAHRYVVSIPKIMGTVNNTSNSGGRDWKYIFDQGWVQKVKTLTQDLNC